MKNTAKRAGVWIVAVLVVLLGFGGEALAAKGAPGPPEGEGSGDHGRKKDSDDQGYLLGLIYGDQWVIVRDVSAEGDGKPIYFTWTWPPEAYNVEGDFVPQLGDLPYYDIEVAITEEPGCVQPVSFEEVTDLGSQFYVSDTGAQYYDSYGRVREAYLIPLDPECKIPDAFAATWGEQVMEVDAGRFNMSRSPQAVMDAAYEEALRIINTAAAIDLDPAGRLLLSIETEDEFGQLVTSEKTIDSPAENLALYQKVMQNGCLADTANVGLTDETKMHLNSSGLAHLVCDGTLFPAGEDFQRAASFLAGAGDKTGRVTLDLVVYLNSRLELNQIIWSADKREIESIAYFDFDDFTYDRCAEHAATTADLLQPPAAYTGNLPLQFDVQYGVSLFDKRFTHDWPQGPCDININGSGAIVRYGVDVPVDLTTPIINFVRAADDALVMIGYIHNYALPVVPYPQVEEY